MELVVESEEGMASLFVWRIARSVQRQYQYRLDSTVPYMWVRWIFLFSMLVLYGIRVWILRGFYIVTYGLGIFLLNLLIGFLTPVDDTEGDGPVLPTNEGDEFKPFVRRLPEFKFWYSCCKAVLVALTLTLFSLFNVPVFWPILLIYFIILFVLTMKRQIIHMKEHNYLPFSWGKKTYTNAKKVKPQSDIRVK